MPSPIASGRLPLHHQPVLLEAWQFATRSGRHHSLAASRMPPALAEQCSFGIRELALLPGTHALLGLKCPSLLPCFSCAASRFSGLLNLQSEDVPSLQQLELSLLGELAPPPLPAEAAGEAAGEQQGDDAVPAPRLDACLQLQLGLLDFLVEGLFVDTATAINGAAAARCMGIFAGVYVLCAV